MAPGRRILFAVIGLLICVIGFELTPTDLWLQQLLYRPSAGQWVWSGAEPVTRFLLYDGAKGVLILFALGLACALLFFWRAPLVRPYTSGIRVVLFSLILVPACVHGLKVTTHVACPRDLAQFGGDLPYVGMLGRYPASLHRAVEPRCFPAGHASAGFALMSLFFFFRTRRNRRLALGLAVATGWIMGGYKMLIGDHFLSHTVTTMLLAWAIINVLVLAERRIFQSAPARLAVLPLILVAGLAQAAEIPAPAALTEFDASYRVKVSLARGWLHLGLTGERDGAMLFSSRIEPSGAARLFLNGTIEEFSEFSVSDGPVTSLAYRRSDTISTKSDHNASLTFDWRNHQITGLERGEPVAFPLAPDTLDRQLIVVALMHDLANGRCLDHYSMYDRGKVREVTVRRLGLEDVSTRVGDFQTIKVEHQSADGKKSTQFWMAPALGFLPVRVNFSTSRKNLKVAGELAELKIGTGEPGVAKAGHPRLESVADICSSIEDLTHQI